MAFKNVFRKFGITAFCLEIIDFSIYSFLNNYKISWILFTEAVALRCSIKKVFLEISQTSQSCNFIKKKTLAQMFSCEFCEISKNVFFYRAPRVAASFFKNTFCSQLSWASVPKCLFVCVPDYLYGQGFLLSF